MTDTATAAAELDQSDLARRIAATAGRIRTLHEAGRRGELAELRRMRRDDVPPEPFWSLVEAYEIPERDEEFWIAILPLMVRHEHQSRAAPGRALAEARVAPSRVERWLRMDRTRAWTEARRILAQVKQPIDWVQLGFLLYFWDHPSWGRKNRHRLARQYFRAIKHQQSPSTGKE